MTKHTPGPWKISTARTWNIFSAESHVATVHFSGLTPTGKQREEVDANARLIAAAPELLALKGALEVMNHSEARVRSTWQQRARTAIAKATEQAS